jgi:hypothetical protein
MHPLIKTSIYYTSIFEGDALFSILMAEWCGFEKDMYFDKERPYS